jgi:hypothetical protein
MKNKFPVLEILGSLLLKKVHVLDVVRMRGCLEACFVQLEDVTKAFLAQFQ